MEASIVNQIHRGAIQFLDDLIGWLPGNRDLIVARMMVDTQLPSVVLAEMLYENVYPYKEAITNRDEKFILSDPDIFSKGGDKALSLKNIWLGKDFSGDDKVTVWKWLDFFIRLLTAYEKIKSGK